MYHLFSVDDHIVEHGSVWVDRLPAKYRDLGPHLVVEDDGTEWWEYEDTRGATTGLNAVAGKPPEFWNLDPLRFSEMIPGCYDPKARAKDFLANGILASVGFPTLPRFGGVLFQTFKDKELAGLCVEAYNDFVLEEWCPGGPPGLYVPMTITKLWDPELAAKEIQRCVEKGAKALCFPEDTYPLGLPSFYRDHWDPVWAVVQETGIPVCMHIGSSGADRGLSPDAPMTVTIAIGNVGAQLALVNLAMSPVCRNFPGLKFVFSEGGIGWLPAALERADRQFQRHRLWDPTGDVTPSDIFRRNMYVCMIDEPIGLKSRYDIGLEKILWETDYPHADTPWPFTQEEVSKTLGPLPEEEVEAITHANAERVFDWKMADPELARKAEPVKPFEWQEGQLHRPGERAAAIAGTGGHQGAHYEFKRG